MARRGSFPSRAPPSKPTMTVEVSLELRTWTNLYHRLRGLRSTDYLVPTCKNICKLCGIPTQLRYTHAHRGTYSSSSSSHHSHAFPGQVATSGEVRPWSCRTDPAGLAAKHHVSPLSEKREQEERTSHSNYLRSDRLHCGHTCCPRPCLSLSLRLYQEQQRTKCVEMGWIHF
jgi:hypothetical protein